MGSEGLSSSACLWARGQLGQILGLGLLLWVGQPETSLGIASPPPFPGLCPASSPSPFLLGHCMSHGQEVPGLLSIFLPHLVLGRGFGFLSSVSQHTGQQHPPWGPGLLLTLLGGHLPPASIGPSLCPPQVGGLLLPHASPASKPIALSQFTVLGLAFKALADLTPHLLCSKTRFPCSLSLSGIYQLSPQAHTCCFVLCLCSCFYCCLESRLIGRFSSRLSSNVTSYREPSLTTWHAPSPTPSASSHQPECPPAQKQHLVGH